MMDEELDLSERLKILPEMPGGGDGPKPLPIRHDIAIVADVLGDAESRYGRRLPVTLSKVNPTGGLAVTFSDVVVDDVLAGNGAGKLSAPKIVVSGLVETWPDQIVAAVPELLKAKQLLDFLKEARSNPTARRLVREWLKTKSP